MIVEFGLAGAALLVLFVKVFGGNSSETPATKVGGAVLQAVENPRRETPALSGMGPMVAGLLLGLALMWVLFG